MGLKKLCHIMLIVSFVVISGCVTGPGCGINNDNGELTISKNSTTDSFCGFDVTYKNIAERMVRPQIIMTYYEANGDTVNEAYIQFAPISPGRSPSATRRHRL